MAGEVFPVVKRIVAVELSKTYGFSQREIAERIGVSQSRVSNYLKTGVKEEETKLKKLVEKLCENIARGKETTLCDVCKQVTCNELKTLGITEISDVGGCSPR